MKLFHKIASISLGLSLALGIGVVASRVGSGVIKEARADTATFTFSTIASANSWANGTAYTTVTIDPITITAQGGGNNGKWYTSSGGSWRMYSGGTVRITSTTGYTITAVSSNPTCSFTITDGVATFSPSTRTDFTSITVTYSSASALSTMLVKNSSGSQSPFNMNYGDNSGQLFYAFESNGTSQITSGVTWSVSDTDILVLETDYADNHCWVKPGTKVGEATLTATKSGYNSVVSTITILKGNLSSIAVTGSFTNTEYAIGDSWNPAGLIVTATYSTGFTADVTAGSTWTYSPALANSTSITSVTATASYEENSVEKTASSNAQTVTVFMGATYDFRTNFATYADTWDDEGNSGYITRSGLDGVDDIGGDYAATIDLYKASKQTSNIRNMPVFACKQEAGAYTQVLHFTLNEVGYKITSVSVTFAQWTTKTPDVALFKGNTVAADPLDTATIGTKNTLSVSNLNGTDFSVGYCDKSTSNVQAGLQSITIGLVELASFGTLDHITVTGLPNTVYHVGETFNSTGFMVTAYDGADEATANFKDVTASVETDLDDPTPFVDGNVPGFDCEVSYSGDGGTDSTSFHVYVYALAEYELVTDEPADWSGNYLIVGTNADEDLCAMNGGVPMIDDTKNYKVVTESSNTIETGQELEWVFASYNSGYSIRGKSGKYIGSLISASNGMLVGDSAYKNTLSISSGNVAIAGTNGYSLVFNTTRDGFRYYSSGTVKLYKLAESDNADEYAQTFLSTLQNNICQVTNEGIVETNKANLISAWTTLKTAYSGVGSKLSALDREEFRLSPASESGTNIQKAVALYDHIVSAYGAELGEGYNFMNRNVVSQGAQGLKASFGESNTLGVVLVITSVITLTAVAGYFLLKKKHA